MLLKELRSLIRSIIKEEYQGRTRSVGELFRMFTQFAERVPMNKNYKEALKINKLARGKQPDEFVEKLHDAVNDMLNDEALKGNEIEVSPNQRNELVTMIRRDWIYFGG